MLDQERAHLVKIRLTRGILRALVFNIPLALVQLSLELEPEARNGENS